MEPVPIPEIVDLVEKFLSDNPSKEEIEKRAELLKTVALFTFDIENEDGAEPLGISTLLMAASRHLERVAWFQP
jgi:hypothetical protein